MRAAPLYGFSCRAKADQAAAHTHPRCGASRPLRHERAFAALQLDDVAVGKHSKAPGLLRRGARTHEQHIKGSLTAPRF